MTWKALTTLLGTGVAHRDLISLGETTSNDLSRSKQIGNSALFPLLVRFQNISRFMSRPTEHTGETSAILMPKLHMFNH